eukprot:2457242-Prorocentrum_lima.AAC.1
MTSSLVGSEMCIRDRWLAGRCEVILHYAPVSHVAYGSPGSSMIDLRAVSYTHLTLPTICSV